MVDEALGKAFGGILVSDFYVAYHHYPGLKQSAAGGLGPPAAGHPQAESVVPGRPGLGQVGPWGAAALHQGRELGSGRRLFLTGAVVPGNAVALAVPAFPGGPVGSPGKTVPAD